MRKLSILISISVIILLVTGLIMSCAEPEPAPAPTPAPTPAPAPAPPAKAITLRMTTAPPPMDVIVTTQAEAAERFNARAGGRYIMEVYGGEQICKYVESLDAVRTGAVEMMSQGLGGYSGTVPELAVAEIPYWYDSVQSNAAAQAGILEINDEVLQKNANQKMLGCFNVSAMELLSTNPVKTMADWKGMLIQSDTTQGMAVIEAMGGSGVVIPFPEVYAALEKGVVDAAMLAPTFINIAKLYEVADYYTLCYALGTTYGTTINLDIWNNMPKDIQDMLSEEITTACSFLNDLKVKLYTEETEAMKGHGIEVYYVPKAERDKWKEACRPYIEEQIARFGEYGQRMKKIAEEANAKYPYPY